MGSCLTLGNELSEETHVLTKQETLLGRAPGGEPEGEGAREDCSAPRLAGPGFCDGIRFQLVSGPSL